MVSIPAKFLWADSNSLNPVVMDIRISFPKNSTVKE
jgi:hypothetical protein